MGKHEGAQPKQPRQWKALTDNGLVTTHRHNCCRSGTHLAASSSFVTSPCRRCSDDTHTMRTPASAFTTRLLSAMGTARPAWCCEAACRCCRSACAGQLRVLLGCGSSVCGSGLWLLAATALWGSAPADVAAADVAAADVAAAGMAPADALICRPPAACSRLEGQLPAMWLLLGPPLLLGRGREGSDAAWAELRLRQVNLCRCCCCCCCCCCCWWEELELAPACCLLVAAPAIGTCACRPLLVPACWPRDSTSSPEHTSMGSSRACWNVHRHTAGWLTLSPIRICKDVIPSVRSCNFLCCSPSVHCTPVVAATLYACLRGSITATPTTRFEVVTYRNAWTMQQQARCMWIQGVSS